jgi:hypothetical protein
MTASTPPAAAAAATVSTSAGAKALDIDSCRQDIERAAVAKALQGSSLTFRQCLLQSGFSEDQASNRTMQMRVRRQVQKFKRQHEQPKKHQQQHQQVVQAQAAQQPSQGVTTTAAVPLEIAFSYEASDDISVLTLDSSFRLAPTTVTPRPMDVLDVLPTSLYIGERLLQQLPTTTNTGTSTATTHRTILPIPRMMDTPCHNHNSTTLCPPPPQRSAERFFDPLPNITLTPSLVDIILPQFQVQSANFIPLAQHHQQQQQSQPPNTIDNNKRRLPTLLEEIAVMPCPPAKRTRVQQQQQQQAVQQVVGGNHHHHLFFAPACAPCPQTQ